MKFAFIDQERGRLSVRAMCVELGVSESGFYRWKACRTRPDRRKGENEAELKRIVARLHRSSRGRYGRPRLLAQLAEQGYAVGSNRLARIMRELGLSGRGGRKRLRRPVDPQPKLPPAPNLLKRNFSVVEPNTVWTGDITELRAGQAKAHLAIVLDLAGRTIVGWKLDAGMQTDLITGALKNAVRRRRPVRGLIFHSDQGVQYASKRFREMLRVLGIRQSMSRRGNCWDNAPTESFFATIKKELVYSRSWSSIAELARAIARYIRFYNSERLHTSLGMRTPHDHETRHVR